MSSVDLSTTRELVVTKWLRSAGEQVYGNRPGIRPSKQKNYKLLGAGFKFEL